MRKMIGSIEAMLVSLVVVFSSSLAFGQTGTLRGNDGKEYRTVRIGNQLWLAENLRETRYRNGDAIPEVGHHNQWNGLKIGARCINPDSANQTRVYGYLYNWYAANDARNIAPEGWRVPTDTDWTTLTNHLGNGAGRKMRATGTEFWKHPGIVAATNESGFTSIPGGFRLPVGVYIKIGDSSVFWSATQSNADEAWNRSLDGYFLRVSRESVKKGSGFSLRLVRDSH